MSGPYNRGPPGGTSEAVGKRRLAKKNPSTSMLTTINTSTSTLNSSLALRPSPASSRSDNLLSPVDDPRSPVDSRQQSKVSLVMEMGQEERQGGLRKKMSLTGTVLGKKPSLRLGLGPLRSQSDASLAESPEERARVLAQIKEKAEKDRNIAHKHAASCSALGAPVPNHTHPIRRRSLLTPGLATRDVSDPLRKPPVDGRVEQRAIGGDVGLQPPATAPLSRPPPSLSAAYRPMYATLSPPESAPLTRLAPLDLAAEDGAIGTPRSSTPSERDYGRLGSGLRITNGIASPNPSVGSARWSNGSPIPQRTYTMPETQLTAPIESAANIKPPLKSRLYMIENADRSEDEVDESHIHPAFRSKPPFDTTSESDALARQYQADLPDSPYDSSVDLNKPLPTPPGSDVKEPPKASLTISSGRSRSNSARPDLDYRCRESLIGDVNRQQEDLYDETLSLLESIGSSHSSSSKPQLMSQTTTTTTSTAVTTPSSISHYKDTLEHETYANVNNQLPAKVVTTTGPIISVVQTTVGNPPHLQVQHALHSAGDTQTMRESPAAATFSSSEIYPRSANINGQPRVALARNDDSGYSSSSYQSSQVQRSKGWERDGSVLQQFGSRSVEISATPSPNTNQGPQSKPPRSSPRGRPSLSSTSRSTRNGSYASRHTHSSSESSTTLLSIRNAVAAPLSPNKRRLKKLRPSSLPPVERIAVQGREVNYSSFIPPVPQDIAARHAQRSAEHPPLAHTVANVRHSRQPSGAGIAPMSAPIKFPSPPRPSNESVSDERPNIDRPSYENLGTERLTNERRNSKSLFASRVFKFVDPAKPTGLDRKLGLRSGSRAERRAASRQQSRDQDFDEEEGAALTDLHEVDELYGASPYDAAASPTTLHGGDLHNPYRHPKFPRPRSAMGMTEAQASEVNRMREQNRWGRSVDGRMATVPEQRPMMPMSAPASEQYFDREAYINPYTIAYRNREWDQIGSKDPYNPEFYDNNAFDRQFSHSPPTIDEHVHSKTGDNHHQAISGQDHRPMPIRRFSDKPTHPSPEIQSSEWANSRRDSGRSHTAPSSPITPMDVYEIDHGCARFEEGDDQDHYGGDVGSGRYDSTSLGHSYEPGRYDGGFSYGYEPGRGVNGSAGTRAWHNSTSRKNVGIGQQYGIDLTDVPIFVAPSVAT